MLAVESSSPVAPVGLPPSADLNVPARGAATAHPPAADRDRSLSDYNVGDVGGGDVAAGDVTADHGGLDVHGVHDGVINAIGQTPLVRLRRFLDTDDVDLLVKLESCNPGGSAKDRPAAMMLGEAIRRGEVTEDSVVIESSSGNMGIGLAQACRYHNIRFICVVDPRTQQQNLDIIAAYGGEIELVREPIGGDFLAARIARVESLLRSTPNGYWPNQYANRDNPRSHYEGTVAEIDDALDGEFDVLLVATSSTGTAQGCRDLLRDRGRDVSIIAVDSCGSALFGNHPGARLIPGLGAGKVPALAQGQSFDRIQRVSDLDCVVGCRRAVDREALLIGGSAGGVLLSVDRLKKQLRGKRCVAVLHDSGTRYMQTVYNDRWVEEVLHCTPDRLRHLVSGIDDSE